MVCPSARQTSLKKCVQKFKRYGNATSNAISAEQMNSRVRFVTEKVNTCVARSSRTSSRPRRSLCSLAGLGAATAILSQSPPSAEAFTLLTFDVDGTLVSSSGWAESAHGRAYPHAVKTILSNNSEKPVNVPSVPDALKREEYHGSTDGLILLRLARAALGTPPPTAAAHLDDMFACMYDYIAESDDEEVGAGLTVLPGVIDTLERLADMNDEVICGLVTGNVEGIARRKMRAVGVHQTGALSPPSAAQAASKSWPGAEDIGFIGGFGSDYCSGDVDDADRNYLDRGEQIAIAVNRCREMLSDGKRKLKRVTHIGDAPADVLAAKSFSERCQEEGDDLCVGMVAVATGSYSANELQELIGERVEGTWEPVVMEDGMAADTGSFLRACGVL